MTHPNAAQHFAVAEELEKQLIGTILHRSGALFEDVIGELSPGDFYWTFWGGIYSIMLNIHRAGQPVTVGAVRAAMVAQGQTVHEITRAFDALSSATQKPRVLLKDLAVGVKQLAVVRRLAEAGTRVSDMALSYSPETPIEELLTASRTLFEDAVRGGLPLNAPMPLNQVLQEQWDAIEESQNAPEPPRLGFDFAPLDRFLGGLAPGTLTIVGARTNSGKTGFLMQAAKSAQCPVLFWSGEQSRRELAGRYVALHTGISTQKIRLGMRDGGMTKEEYRLYVEFSGSVAKRPLYFFDEPNITPETLTAHARYVSRQAEAAHGQPLGLIVVDYVALMNWAHLGKTEYAGLTRVVIQLKNLARELCPVVAAAQLGRAAAATSVPPNLAQLKSTGELEQSADYVILLHRPYYDDPNRNREAVVMVRKNRHGDNIADFPAYFSPERVCFFPVRSEP